MAKLNSKVEKTLILILFILTTSWQAQLHIGRVAPIRTQRPDCQRESQPPFTKMDFGLPLPIQSPAIFKRPANSLLSLLSRSGSEQNSWRMCDLLVSGRHAMYLSQRWDEFLTGAQSSTHHIFIIAKLKATTFPMSFPMDILPTIALYYTTHSFCRPL